MKEIIINNKLTTNNKLNLPTTWTKKKMMSLVLMTWLSVNGTEAGQAFKNCLTNEHGDTTSYDLLLNLAYNSDVVNSGNRVEVCCSKNQCSVCYIDAPNHNFACRKVLEIVGCGYKYLPICRGKLGNTIVTTNTTLGNYCATNNISLSEVARYISTITPIGLAKGYAH